MALDTDEMQRVSERAAHRQRVLLVVEDAPEDVEVIERQLRRLPDVHYVVHSVPVGGGGSPRSATASWTARRPTACCSTSTCRT